MPRRRMTTQQFAGLVRHDAAGAAANPPLVTQAFVGGLTEVEHQRSGKDGRAFAFTLSTPLVNHMGDRVSQDGWRLDSYRANPVVLWAHDDSALPIAEGVDIRVEGETLKGVAVFPPNDFYAASDRIVQHIKRGLLRAVSVGFVPIRWRLVDDSSRPFGVDFLEQELVEFSIVNVPANPEALIDPVAHAMAAGAVDGRTVEADRGGDAAGPGIGDWAAAAGAAAPPGSAGDNGVGGLAARMMRALR